MFGIEGTDRMCLYCFINNDFLVTEDDLNVFFPIGPHVNCKTIAFV